MAETKFYLKVVDQATAGIKQVNNSFSGLFSTVTSGTKALLSFQSTMSFFASGFLVREFSRFSLSFIEAADKFERLDIKLKAMGASFSKKDIIAFARQNPSMAIDDITDAFVKLRAVGINPLSGSMQSLADATAAFGLTGADVSKVLLAIQQIAGKGVLSMEELRGQLGERVGTAIEIIMKKLGYAKDDFKRFSKDVELGAIDARRALTALFDGFDERYQGSSKEMANTWSGIVQGMKNEWTIMQDEIMTPEFLNSFKKALQDITKSIKDNSNEIRSALLGVVSILKEIIELSASLVNDKSTLRTGIGTEWASLKKYFIERTPLAWTDWGKNKIKESESDINILMNAWAQNQIKRPESGYAEGLQAQQEHFERIRNVVLARKRIEQGTPESGDLDISRGLPPRKGAGVESKQHFYQPDNKATYSWISNPDYPGRPMVMNALQKVEKSIYDSFLKVIDTMNLVLKVPDRSPMEKVRVGFKKTIDDMIFDFKEMFNTFEKIGAYAAKTISEAMANSFNDFFIDAMEGRLKQFKDYLLGFFKEIGAAISRLLSQYLAQQLLGSVVGSMSFGGSAANTGSSYVPKSQQPVVTPARMKATGGATSSPNIQIINNSGTPLQGSASTQTNDIGETVMVIVLDAIGRNKGGSRDMLRGMLAT